MHGGDIVGEVLQRQGVKFLFTLCGGHIAPILKGAKDRGVRIIDVRHEVTTVFAADAVARLSGVPGVAAVTAGPGVTNTITAVKNAQMAQSPIVLLGGATATALKGRGALQDIDQMALIKPHVKWAKAAKRVRDLAPMLEEAFQVSQSGVPGPVFLECPVDLLYDESLVRSWYGLKSDRGKSLADKAIKMYLDNHVNRVFAGGRDVHFSEKMNLALAQPDSSKINDAWSRLQSAERPLMLVGSQAVLDAKNAKTTAEAVAKLGVPVYLSGMARGLLGKGHPLQMRHKRRNALKEADLVLLAGVPCDFRLDYGNHIRRSATYISANISKKDMSLNRRPNLGVLGDPGAFIRALSQKQDGSTKWDGWIQSLRERDHRREEEIQEQANASSDLLNPVHLCRTIENELDENSVLVADGGDFVATASYTMSPRGPLRWLDPGPFGTLGVGAGFALGAKLCRPDAEVWIIYGDGSVGYSLSEFDSFVRHELPVIAVVGNDASWMQIAREQVEILEDDVGTVLRRTDYDAAAAGFGGQGFVLKSPGDIEKTLEAAKAAAQDGNPVLINAHLGKTDFRKGSISM